MRKPYDPVAHSARNKLWNAIWYHGFKRQSRCENCASDQNIHAHHDDYSKPLEVRWLCSSCHKQHHVNLAKAGKAA